MKAIRVHETGDVSKLVYEDAPMPEPKEGEVRVKVEAAGLNFIDTYHRMGWYPLSTPFTLGLEAGGVVDRLRQVLGVERSQERVGGDPLVEPLDQCDEPRQATHLVEDGVARRVDGDPHPSSLPGPPPGPKKPPSGRACMWK